MSLTSHVPRHELVPRQILKKMEINRVHIGHKNKISFFLI